MRPPPVARTMTIALRLVTVLIIITLFPMDALCQEVYVFGGISQDGKQSSVRSGAWGLSYMEEFGQYFAGSFTWINEGHLGGHHRDGPAVQVWYRRYLRGKSLSLEAGAGPYFYYDTKRRQSNTMNTHGLGGVFSLAATWHFSNKWLLQLRTNWIETSHDPDTLSVTVAVGYKPKDDTPASSGPARTTLTGANEIGLLAGQTADNSYEEDHAAALALEYRRRILPFLEWTAGWLNETDSSFAGRFGPYTQLFAVRDFFDARLSLGLGLGPYLARDNRSEENTNVAAMFTMTAAYRFASPWLVRISWNRITTHYHCDADVIMGGVGYRF